MPQHSVFWCKILSLVLGQGVARPRHCQADAEAVRGRVRSRGLPQVRSEVRDDQGQVDLEPLHRVPLKLLRGQLRGPEEVRGQGGPGLTTSVPDLQLPGQEILQDLDLVPGEEDQHELSCEDAEAAQQGGLS